MKSGQMVPASECSSLVRQQLACSDSRQFRMLFQLLRAPPSSSPSWLRCSAPFRDSSSRAGSQQTESCPRVRWQFDSAHWRQPRPVYACEGQRSLFARAAGRQPPAPVRSRLPGESAFSPLLRIFPCRRSLRPYTSSSHSSGPRTLLPVLWTVGQRSKSMQLRG